MGVSFNGKALREDINALQCMMDNTAPIAEEKWEGVTFEAKGATLKVIEKASGFVTKQNPGYWVKVVKGNFDQFGKGEEFTMSADMIRKYAKIKESKSVVGNVSESLNPRDMKEIDRYLKEIEREEVTLSTIGENIQRIAKIFYDNDLEGLSDDLISRFSEAVKGFKVE